MPIPIITQNPAIVWDFMGSFPYPRWEDTHLIAPGMPVNRYSASAGAIFRDNSGIQGYVGRTNNFAAAGWALRTDTGGPTYVQMESAGAGTGILGLDAFRCQADIGTGFALASGAEHSSQRRVWWLRWLMQSPSAAPPERCGLLCTPANNGNVTRWIDNAATRGGFGFVGDGAGQFVYRSYNGSGPSVIRETIALPAHTLTEWNMCELIVVSARVGIPATLEIWFNGALIATRNWTGALLEPYAAQEWYFLPLMGGGTTGAGGAAVNFMDIENRQGRFLRSGIEV